MEYLSKSSDSRVRNSQSTTATWGSPNLFVPLTTELYQKKIQYLMDAFQSQRTKRWFEESTFLSLMRLRGMECNAPSGYAEAFHCRKLVL